MYYLTSNEWVHQILYKTSKNMSFFIKNDEVKEKYYRIWDKIKENWNIKFHSMAVYDETYIKAKVREFDGVIKTNFLVGKVPKENMHYTYIACITIFSVMRMKNWKMKNLLKSLMKNYPQVYLNKWKYRIKKMQIWIRVRVRIWYWINGYVRISFWFWIRHFTLTSVLTIHFRWIWTKQKN